MLLLSLFLSVSAANVQAIQMDSEQQRVDINYREPQPADTPGVFWMVVQMILALGLILVLAWGAIRIFGSGLRSRMQGNYVRILDEVALGANRSVVVIEIGGKSMLLGVTDHQITMLGELQDPQLIQDMIASAQMNPNGFAPGTNVWQQLKELFGPSRSRTSRTRAFDAMVDNRMEVLKKMTERLRGLNESGHRDSGWKQ